MATNANDHVHRLIHSMTRAEKRYYKLFISRHKVGGRTIHFELFNAMSAAAEYDEKALLAKFKKRAFTKNFSVTKRRMYEGILDALAAFHVERSVDGRLRRRLQEVEILYRRALYEDAAKLLRGVVKQAEQHERPAAMLEALEWQRRCLERNKYAGVREEELTQLEEKAVDLRSQLEEMDALWSLKSQVFISLYRKGHVRESERLKEVAAILEQPWARKGTALRSRKAKYLFHHLHSVATFAMADLASCRTHLLANLAIMEADKELFIEESGQLLSVLSNLAYVCMRLGLHDDAARYLKDLRSAPGRWDMPDNDDLELKLFATSYSLELSMYCHQGEFAKAVAVIPRVEQGIERYGERLGAMRKGSFLYQTAYAYFGADKPEEALRACHSLLNEMRPDGARELIGFARVLELIIRYEQGEFGLITYTLRNTERSIRAHGQEHAFEAAFLKLMHALLKARTEEKRRVAFEEFLVTMERIQHDPLEQAVFDHLDPIAWAQSRINDRPFAEMVRSRQGTRGKAA